MCRSVRVMALPLVAQAFVADDVVLESFSLQISGPNCFHDVAFSRCPFGRTFGNRPTRSLK